MSTTWRSRVTSTSSSAKTKKQRLGKPECTASSEASAAASRERASSATWEEHQPARSWKNTTTTCCCVNLLNKLSESWLEKTVQEDAKKRSRAVASAQAAQNTNTHYDNGQKKQIADVASTTPRDAINTNVLQEPYVEHGTSCGFRSNVMLTTTTTVTVISSREHSQMILSHRTLN